MAHEHVSFYTRYEVFSVQEVEGLEAETRSAGRMDACT